MGRLKKGEHGYCKELSMQHPRSQGHTQQQHQVQLKSQQRAMMEMHRVLSGRLDAGGGLGGGLMNTGSANSTLGLPAASLNPLEMGGNMGSAGIAAASDGLGRWVS